MKLVLTILSMLFLATEVEAIKMGSQYKMSKLCSVDADGNLDQPGYLDCAYKEAEKRYNRTSKWAIRRL